MSHANRQELEIEIEQCAIADFDLMWCERYLIAYIELMTPPVHADNDTWVLLKSKAFPGDHNFLDILGRSLVTSIIISYCRPWSANRGRDGRRLCLNKTLLEEMARLRCRSDESKPLLPFHRIVHDRILRERDKVIAHSDSSEWDISIKIDEISGVETSLDDPLRYVSLDEARELLDNTQSLRSQIDANRRRAMGQIRGQGD